MMAIFAESPLSPDRPTQTVWRGRRRPEGWMNGGGDGCVGCTSWQPVVERGIGVGGKDDVATRGVTASRRMRIEEETKRGDDFARPEDINGVIPGAVEVADCN
jgi:hypothetical protein